VWISIHLPTYLPGEIPQRKVKFSEHLHIYITYYVCGLLYNNILYAFLLAENWKEELEE
jgi:hypothetical protein